MQPVLRCQARAKLRLGWASVVVALAGASCGATSQTAPASTTCPDREPTPGDYCNYQSEAHCDYEIDKCRSVAFECNLHAWRQIAPADGVAYDCSSFQPPNAPQDGDACECLGVLDCAYEECAGRGKIHATCDDTTWHVTDTPCPRQPCGPNDGLSCGPGDVCLVHAGPKPTFSCVPNPCGGALTSCECAASLCEAFESCSIVVGTVACSCPTC